MRVPVAENQVAPDTLRIARQPKANVLRAASGEDVARAGVGVGRQIGNSGDDIHKVAKKIYDNDQDQLETNLYTQYERDKQNILYNPEVEKIKVDGKEFERPKGVLNRQLGQARGSTMDYQSKVDDYAANILGNVQDVNTRLRLSRRFSLDALATREQVQKHEITQERADKINTFDSGVKSAVDNAYTSRNSHELGIQISNGLIAQTSKDRMMGVDPKSSELNQKKTVTDIVSNATLGALNSDVTGTTSMQLLDSYKELVGQAEYEKIAKDVKKSSKKLIDDGKEMMKQTQYANEAAILGDVAAGKTERLNLNKINELANKGLIRNEFATATIRALQKPITEFEVDDDDIPFIERANALFASTDKKETSDALLSVLDGFSSGNLSQTKMTLLVQAAQKIGEPKAQAFRDSYKSVYDWGVDAGMPVSYQSELTQDYLKGINAGVDPAAAAENAIGRALKLQAVKPTLPEPAQQRPADQKPKTREQILQENWRDDLTFAENVLTMPEMNALFDGLTKFAQNRVVGNIGLGQAGLVESVGGLLNWLGKKEWGSRIVQESKLMKETFKVKDPKFSDKLTQGISSTFSFLVPGLGVARGAMLLRASPIIASFLGIGTSSLLESGVEAGGNFEEAKERGMTDDQANDVAKITFWMNLPVLAGTNVFGGMFNPAKQVAKQGAKKMTLNAIIKTVLEKGGRGVRAAGGEGAQEGGQQMISNKAIGDPLMKDVPESAAIGALVGGGIGTMIASTETPEVQDNISREITAKQSLVAGALAGIETISNKGNSRDVTFNTSLASNFEVISAEHLPQQIREDAVKEVDKSLYQYLVQGGMENQEAAKASKTIIDGAIAGRVETVETNQQKSNMEAEGGPAQPQESQPTGGETFQSAVVKGIQELVPTWRFTAPDLLTAHEKVPQAMAQAQEQAKLEADPEEKQRNLQQFEVSRADALARGDKNAVEKLDKLIDKNLGVPGADQIFSEATRKGGTTMTKQSIAFAEKNKANKDIAVRALQNAKKRNEAKAAEIGKIPAKKRTAEQSEQEDLLTSTGQFFTEAEQALEGKLNLDAANTAVERAKKMNKESGQVVLPPALEAVAEKIGEVISPESRENLYQQTFNRFQSIENVAEKAKALGAPIEPGTDPGLSATRFLSNARQAENVLEKGTFEVTKEGKVKVTGEGLKPILDEYEKLSPEEDQAVRRQDLKDYLVAKRTIEDLQRPKNDYSSDQIVTPEQVAEQQKTLQRLNQKYGTGINVFAQTAQRLYDFQKRVLHSLVDAGNISQEQYENIVEKNPNYIPFDRVLPEEEATGLSPTKNPFSGARSPVKKIKGSDLAIQDPIESMIKNTYTIMDRASRNKVFKDVFALKGLKELEMQEIKPKMVPVAEVEHRAALDADYLNQVKTFAESLGAKIKTEGQPGRRLGYYRPGTKETVRNFGTPEEVISHEVGHFLDFKYQLKQRFYNKGKTKEVGAEIKQFMIDQGQSQARVDQVEERFAHAFEWWLSNRALAEKDIPLFSKEINKIIKEIPELKPLLDIRPKPGLSLESMREKVFIESQFKPKGNVIEGFIDGKRKYLELPENLYKAMTGMDEVSSGLFVKILSQPANWLRTGATITPEFVLRNPIRDQWTALLQTHVGFRPFFDSAGAISDIMQKNEVYSDWIRSGGAYSSFVELSRPHLRDMANELLGNPNALKNLNIVSTMQDLSQLMEQATRLGVFKAGVRSGLSPVEAAKESREATLDFARRGTATKELNKVYAFFNANLQALDKNFRTAAKDPGGLAAKGVASITIPSLLLYLKNRLDDDYRELPRWQKDLFWMTKIGDTWVRIPKPFLYGQIFGSIPERFFEYLDTKDKSAFDGVQNSLISALSPIAGDPVGELIPTAIKSLVENETNWSFFRQRPIVPEGKKNLIPAEQSSEYDTDTSKMLGALLNVSPSKIENLVQGYFGGSGRYVMQGGDLLMNLASRLRGEEQPPDAPATASDIPLVKGFVARNPIGSQSESLSKFYDQRKELDSLKATYNAYVKRGEPAKAKKFLDDNPSVKFVKQYDKAASSIKKIDQQIDKVEKADIPDVQKRQQLDLLNRQKVDIAKKVNEDFNKGGQNGR